MLWNDSVNLFNPEKIFHTFEFNFYFNVKYAVYRTREIIEICDFEILVSSLYVTDDLRLINLDQGRCPLESWVATFLALEVIFWTMVISNFWFYPIMNLLSW